MVGGSSACSGCLERDQIIARLQEEVRRLREQLDQMHQEEHRQAGKFRRRHLNNNPKKPGRPKGHHADLRPLPTPEQVDRVINVPCKYCPDCKVELCDPAVVVQYQTDLPPIVPLVTQFNIETGYCPSCRLRRQGRHPEQISDAIGAAGNIFGPVLLTMAAELKHRLGVPYRKICDFFTTYCHLEICPAAFARADQRLAERAQPTYDLLIEALRRCGVVHADETGWRIQRLNAWLWVFTSQTITIYTIRTSRGHEVAEDILGKGFDGFLIVDGLATYDVLDVAKGRCNGHLLRRCKNLLDTVPTPEQRYLDQLIALLREAIDLARRRDQLTATGYARRVQELEDRLDHWLDHLPSTRSAELDRLDTHVRKHRGEWFVFLHYAEVPPTNNHAEQMLRPAVISRKVGGCNKSLLGALVHSILASIMVTCQQQGKRFLELAKRLWQAREPQALDCASWPDG